MKNCHAFTDVYGSIGGIGRGHAQSMLTVMGYGPSGTCIIFLVLGICQCLMTNHLVCSGVSVFVGAEKNGSIGGIGRGHVLVHVNHHDNQTLQLLVH